MDDSNYKGCRSLQETQKPSAAVTTIQYLYYRTVQQDQDQGPTVVGTVQRYVLCPKEAKGLCAAWQTPWPQAAELSR